MGRYAWREFLACSAAIVLAIGAGRFLASRITDEKRKAAGGIAILISVVLTLYGVNSVNSASSHLKELTGKTDTIGMIAICFGLIVGLFGVGALLSKTKCS